VSGWYCPKYIFGTTSDGLTKLLTAWIAASTIYFQVFHLGHFDVQVAPF
jgi:hypothetical protein